MVGEKVEHFQGKGSDLSALQSHIEEYLKTDGFTTQTSAPSAQGVAIQAKKGGFLRGVVDADRAMTIMIAGFPPISRSVLASVSGSSTSGLQQSKHCSSRTYSSSWMWPKPPGISRSKTSSSRTSSHSSANRVVIEHRATRPGNRPGSTPR